MKLERFTQQISGSDREEEKYIDFGAAGLYVPAAQTIFATTLSSCVSVLACWIIPIGAISAVRTLALTAISGIIVIQRPFKIGETRGVNTIFSALRPCCVIYVCSLVVEQLIHTCISEESTYEHGFWRRVVYHACLTTMTLSSFLRSKSPRAESDVPFLISTACIVIIAILPPPALALSGPLCSPPSLILAGERVVRAFLFSCVYVVLVYSAAPISNNLPDTLVCIMRSASSSAWVLGAVSYSLPLATVQMFVVLYYSFSAHQTQYNSVGLGEDLEFQPNCPTQTSSSCTSDCDNNNKYESDEIATALSIINRSGSSTGGMRSVSTGLASKNFSFDLSRVGCVNAKETHFHEHV
jgi:hypothetical protein